MSFLFLLVVIALTWLGLLLAGEISNPTYAKTARIIVIGAAMVVIARQAGLA